MAEGGFFARLFGLNNSNAEQENQTTSMPVENDVKHTEATLQDAINFVAELQSYYYNDICKMQTDLLIQANLSEYDINFINKKIKQDKIALEQIDEILSLVTQAEREFQKVWRKSVYSFYDEIEKSKLSKAKSEIFTILLKLCEINTKPELDTVISGKLKTYMHDWNIDYETSFSKNNNAILVDQVDGIVTYNFGNFSKQVCPCDSEKTLSANRLNKLRALEFEYEIPITTSNVWVHVSSIARLQLNFMRRTCILENSWEYMPDMAEKLCFDIVKTEELEQYIRGILQIVLTQNTFAVISIVIPTEKALAFVGPTNIHDDKIEICKKYRFYLKERCNKNIMTTRIDRRNIPEKLQFVSYPNFKREYF